MRPDMAKVITERPRWGSDLPSQKKGYHRKLLQTMPIEDWQLHEPMLGRWRGKQRGFTDRLGPLARFLRSQVGRPWNLVQQELFEHISFDNLVQKHLLTHVWQYIYRSVECRNGVLVSTEEYVWGRPVPVGQLYVCPQSGLLKIVSPSRRTSPPRLLRESPADTHTVHLRRRGIWYCIRLQTLPEDGTDRWDTWLERTVSLADKPLCSATYDAPCFAISVNGVSPETVRRLLRKHEERTRQKKRRTRLAAACH